MPKGQKPGCTPEITSRIAREMALGLSLASAAQRCAVNARTAQDWYQRGRAGGKPYDAFAAAIKKAEADREQRLLAVIDAACKPDKQGKISWMAAAWKLERLHPDKWGRPPQLVRVIDETPDQATKKASADELRNRLAKRILALSERGGKSSR
jgi:hypothetical protein